MSNKTAKGHPIHPIIALIGKAIALHLLYGENTADDDMLMAFILKQAQIYHDGR
jgi:hypothetical protein